jgi:hypothetical protein
MYGGKMLDQVRDTSRILYGHPLDFVLSVYTTPPWGHWNIKSIFSICYFLVKYALKSERIGFLGLAGQFAEYGSQKNSVHLRDRTPFESGYSIFDEFLMAMPVKIQGKSRRIRVASSQVVYRPKVGRRAP